MNFDRLIFIFFIALFSIFSRSSGFKLNRLHTNFPQRSTVLRKSPCLHIVKIPQTGNGVVCRLRSLELQESPNGIVDKVSAQVSNSARSAKDSFFTIVKGIRNSIMLLKVMSYLSPQNIVLALVGAALAGIGAWFLHPNVASSLLKYFQWQPFLKSTSTTTTPAKVTTFNIADIAKRYRQRGETIDVYGRVPNDNYLFSNWKLTDPDLFKQSFPEAVCQMFMLRNVVTR